MNRYEEDLIYIFIYIFSLIMFVGCIDDKQTIDEQSNSIQYYSTFHTAHEIATDIRIITLTKDGNTHDYVVANNRSGRGGGIAIEHWAGCACRDTKH